MCDHLHERVDLAAHGMDGSGARHGGFGWVAVWAQVLTIAHARAAGYGHIAEVVIRTVNALGKTSVTAVKDHLHAVFDKGESRTKATYEETFGAFKQERALTQARTTDLVLALLGAGYLKFGYRFGNVSHTVKRVMPSISVVKQAPTQFLVIPRSAQQSRYATELVH